MGTLSAYAENALMDHVFNAAISTPSFYIGLSDTDPTNDGSGINEPVGASYARVAVAPAVWSTSTILSLQNEIPIAFSKALEDWFTASHYIVMDALTGGNMWGWGTFDEPKVIVTNNTPSIAIGEIVVTMGGVVSVYLGNALLNFIFNQVAYTPPDKFIGVSTTLPNADGTNMNEPVGNNYAREQITAWADAVNGVVDNEEQFDLNSPTGPWGDDIEWSPIFDAVTSGNFLLHTIMTPAQSIGTGDIIRWPIGAYNVTLRQEIINA